MELLTEQDLDLFTKRSEERIMVCSRFLELLFQEVSVADKRFGNDFDVDGEISSKFIIMQEGASKFQAFVVMLLSKINPSLYFHKGIGCKVKIQAEGESLETWKDCIVESGTRTDISTTFIRAKLFIALQRGLDALTKINNNNNFAELPAIDKAKLNYNNTMKLSTIFGEVEIEILPCFCIIKLAKPWFRKHYTVQPTFAVAKSDGLGPDPEFNWSLHFYKDDHCTLAKHPRIFNLSLLFREKYNLSLLTKNRISDIIALLKNPVDESKPSFVDFLKRLVRALEEKRILCRYERDTFDNMNYDKDADIIKTLYRVKRYLVMLDGYLVTPKKDLNSTKSWFHA